MQKLLRNVLVGALAMFAFSGTTMAISELSTGFTDVNSANPYYTAILDLQARGIISGYPDGSFKPDQSVNRVEALKIILNSAQINSSSSNVVASFSDIDTTQWYMPFLNKAVELKIVQGYPDGSFKPTQTVNLAENLKMLLNARGVDTVSIVVTTDPFADVGKNEWYAKFAQYAKDKKLIDADAENRIFPAQGMSRGKLAELAYRLIQVQEKGLDYFGQVKEGTPGNSGGVTNDQTLSVSIKNMAFNKSSMTIAQGTTVRWSNDDTVTHSVVADDGSFTSPALAPGQSWTHTFDKLGTFNYHCSFHPSMTGQIIVKPADQVPTI